MAVARKRNVRQRKALLVILSGLSLALLYGIVFGDRGVSKYLTLTAKLERRSVEAHGRIVRNRRLLEHLAALREDQRTLEEVARTKLGVAGDDEIVFVFRDKHDSDSAIR